MEKNTDTTIRIMNDIHVCFQYFRYGLNFLYQKIKAINRNTNHNHSRTKARDDDEHNWTQYTKIVDIT